MTWLCPKLNRRVQIGTASQTANDEGGFDFEFNSLLSVWMGLKPIAYRNTIRTEYIRGVQISEIDTHWFVVRKCAIVNLGKEFQRSFSYAFTAIEDMSMVKSDYFLFVQKDSTVNGRLFRINNISDNNDQGEYFNITAEEIEQRGTGFAL